LGQTNIEYRIASNSVDFQGSISAKLSADIPRYMFIMTSTTSSTTYTPLARQDTLLEDDPSWTKPPYILGLPTPIPPRNEPSLSHYLISEANDVGAQDDTSHSTPRSGSPICEAAVPDAGVLGVRPIVIVELGLQVSISHIFVDLLLNRFIHLSL
jgi:hypothetical protein